MNDRIAVGTPQRRLEWLVGCTLVDGLAGIVPARPVAASCLGGEIVRMRDPVVTVIEGQGDAATQQAQLEGLALSYIEGSSVVVLGQVGFEIEVSP